jgi:UDP-glucose 4-epimerase
MRRILVTGAATRIGGRLIQRLEQDPDTEVLAVDDLDPVERFSSRFERLNIDHLSFARFLLDKKPHTVIHLQTVDRSALLGSTRAHEESTVGAQALFGAIGRCTTVRHVIVKSDGAVYGAGPRSPSVVGVGTKPARSTGRYQRDLEQMEAFVHDMAERHDHVDYTILRLAPIFGPTIGNPLSAYLTLPGVPTLLGFDPRLQLISEHDALNVFHHVTDNPVPGTFNIAGTGQLYLSRILRLGRRVPQPLPKRAFHAALRGIARTGIPLPKHTISLLKHGRVMDTSGMEDTLGFTPSLTCRQTTMVAYGRVSPELT